MTRVVSIAIAGAVTATALLATAAPAAADWHPRHHGNFRPHYHAAPPSNPGAGVAAGLFFGLAAGALIASAPEPYYYPPAPEPVYVAPPPYYPPQPAYQVSWSEHVAWCRANYPAYNVQTDTYFDVNGGVHACVGPY